MIEVIVFLLLVLIVFLVLLGSSVWSKKKNTVFLSEKISSINQQLLIAKRRFMQGKIKKDVFDSITHSLESELFLAEFDLFRLKKNFSEKVKGKTDEIMNKMDKPTKHRRQIVERILNETEFLKEELIVLEKKFFKNEIKKSVFSELVTQKESELIRKEKELMDVVLKAKI